MQWGHWAIPIYIWDKLISTTRTFSNWKFVLNIVSQNFGILSRGVQFEMPCPWSDTAVNVMSEGKTPQNPAIKNSVLLELLCQRLLNNIYTPASTKLKGGILVLPCPSVCPSVRPSGCPSVRLWTESCPLCIFNNTRRIHFLFAHLTNNFRRCVACNVPSQASSGGRRCKKFVGAVVIKISCQFAR